MDARFLSVVILLFVLAFFLGLSENRASYARTQQLINAVIVDSGRR